MSCRVLVVGGAGYIGSHMAVTLQDAGFEVVIFDNLSRGNKELVNQFPLVEGDLLSPSDLDRCFSLYDFDLVMHFAALAYVGESVVQPEMYYQNNVVGALNLLSAMRRKNELMRLVFSSTCATYGEPDQIPITEAHLQCPVNPYGRTKLMIENVLADYAYAYGLKSISLRYFNAAGSDPLGRVGERHDPETHLIPLVLKEALRLRRGEDPGQSSLCVFGNNFPTKDGSCIRDYIHVTDLCSAHLMAARRLLAGESKGAEFYNLANGKGFSVLEVIDACCAVTGQQINFRVLPRRQGDPAVLIGDASRAAEVLGWKPQVTELKDIIQTAWDWMSRE